MVTVTLNETVLAVSANTIVVEGNHYFPPQDVKLDLFHDSKTRQAFLIVADSPVITDVLLQFRLSLERVGINSLHFLLW